MWIENRKSYRIRQVICVILGLCASLIFTTAVMKRQEVLAAKEVSSAQAELADTVFRFHILANSDRKADQELKLMVRDQVLSYIKEHISEKEQLSADDMKDWVLLPLQEIEQAAFVKVREEGYDYPVRAKVLNCYFPDRRYGDVLFPKGYYEALRLEIGEALGHNWWCALYPALCFKDATCAVVPEEGQKELEDVLGEETYETVTADTTNMKIKSFFYELFRGKNDD